MKGRAIAIGAHPDDIEIGCGGTLRLLADHDYETKHIVVTSGEQGTLTRDDQILIKREDEAKESADVLGAQEIIFLREPDGLTTFSIETKIRVIKAIRDFKPEIVFIHSSFDHFPDHKIVSELCKSAIQAAGGPWYGAAGANPHSVSRVYGFEVWNPTPQPQLIVDITKTIERKLQALDCHKTQIQVVNYLEAVRGLSAYRGAMLMTGAFAEAFEVIKLEVGSFKL